MFPTIVSIYILTQSLQHDRMYWAHTNAWIFSVKIAYFQAGCSRYPGEVGYSCFPWWKKAWGLNLPLKFAFLSRKSFNRTLAVKDGLRQRKLMVEIKAFLAFIKRQQ